jgi:hypothetical protein
MEDVGNLSRLRRLVDLIDHFTTRRDAEIRAMRDQINPETGKPWTWDQIAAEGRLSRQGVIKIYNRTVPTDKTTPASPVESDLADTHTDQAGQEAYSVDALL